MVSTEFATERVNLRYSSLWFVIFVLMEIGSHDEHNFA